MNIKKIKKQLGNLRSENLSFLDDFLHESEFIWIINKKTTKKVFINLINSFSIDEIDQNIFDKCVKNIILQSIENE